MKVEIPLMIQDPTTSLADRKLVQGFWPDREKFLLDGPVSDRIAVLDFCPETGKLLPGARLIPPEPANPRGYYADASGNDVRDAEGDALYESAFLQVNTFATVLKTMYLFEEVDTLGRSLTWAFNAPQLLVVPRAGERANAYYHRDSHSLQFFYSSSPVNPRKTIYTCLSRDIVAHETGHAIIDGIAPCLLNASAPQSLAIHEAIADLTALFMAFDSRPLRLQVLDITRGSIERSTAFSSIAEEFGVELKRRRKCLRELNNTKSLDASNLDEPHQLSEVLGGALYRVLIKIHEYLRSEYAQLPRYRDRPDPLFSASGYALYKAARRIRRMLFRALDWLPIGEISFADLGRAMIAVDSVAYPDDPKMRGWIGDEFLARQIIPDAASLEVPTNLGASFLTVPDVLAVYRSDWYAYDFVNNNRELLCIPPDVPFEIPSRLRVCKKYDHDRLVAEYIFKVFWEHREPNDIGPDWPEERWITVGTTLVIDHRGQILVRLTSAPPLKTGEDVVGGYDREAEYEQQRKERDEYLRSLAESGVLQMDRTTLGPDGQPLLMTQAESSDGAMRMRGTANLLHIVGEA